MAGAACNNGRAAKCTRWQLQRGIEDRDGVLRISKELLELVLGGLESVHCWTGTKRLSRVTRDAGKAWFAGSKAVEQK